MMEEKATVVAIEKGIITVQSQVKSTCSSCQQSDTCGSGIVAKAIPQKTLTVTLISELSMNVGDCVILGIPENEVLKTAWQVYLWPLIGLIVSSAVGQKLVEIQVLPHELFGLVLGVLGGYLGYRFAKYWQNRAGSMELLQPKVLRVLPKSQVSQTIVIKEL